eukprot:30336-Prorocentrum_minimum.AAC.3
MSSVTKPRRQKVPGGAGKCRVLELSGVSCVGEKANRIVLQLGVSIERKAEYERWVTTLGWLVRL